MADGEQRHIAEVSVGDRVAGMNGTTNTVVAIEKATVGVPPTVFRSIDSEPFVTAEHPFMTARGWCSIDPSALRAEGCVLDVTTLRTGDRLLSVASIGVLTSNAGAQLEVSFELDPLRSLVSVEADQATQLYNLLLDGDHTYVANGVCSAQQDLIALSQAVVDLLTMSAAALGRRQLEALAAVVPHGSVGRDRRMRSATVNALAIMDQLSHRADWLRPAR